MGLKLAVATLATVVLLGSHCLGDPLGDSLRVISHETISANLVENIVFGPFPIRFQSCVFPQPINVSRSIKTGISPQLAFIDCTFSDSVFVANTTLRRGLFLIRCVFQGPLIVDRVEFMEDSAKTSYDESFEWVKNFPILPPPSFLIESCQFNDGLILDSLDMRPGGLFAWGSNIKGLVIKRCFGDRILLLQNELTSQLLFGLNTAFYGLEINECTFDSNSTIVGNLQFNSFRNCNFHGTVFEPDSLPKAINLTSSIGLESLRYATNPGPLASLRNEFRVLGFRDQERMITYAMKKAENQTVKIKYLNWLLFDLTCDWGLEYTRPLWIVFWLFLGSWVFYFVVVVNKTKSDIFREWRGRHRNKSVTWRIPIRRLRVFARRRTWLVLRLTLLFSIMSAFNIGFRDFNFGRWIRNITRNEYDLRATGWIRSISGAQALLSVYLFALFLLTYFGRPFD